jgi:hypothetical protein
MFWDFPGCARRRNRRNQVEFAAALADRDVHGETAWVVPSRHGVLNRYLRRPSDSCSRRSVAKGGRAA